MSNKKIKSALISVFHKDGLKPVLKALYENNVMIYSTGGTEKFIKDLNMSGGRHLEIFKLLGRIRRGSMLLRTPHPFPS